MPHSDHSPSPSPDDSDTTFPGLPPFSSSVPTAPLLRISLDKLLRHDAEEEERCWNACCELGFFYLDLRTPSSLLGQGLLKDADELFDVMQGFFDMSVEEKTKYDFVDRGSYFGYKGYGMGVVDKEGNRDRNEFYNISKDDILGLSEPLPSPAVLNSHRPLFKSYIEASHEICTLVTSLLSARLPLTPSARSAGGLPALHDLHTTSGDQIRFVKAPPSSPQQQQQQQQHDEHKPGKAVALGEHTDFGSVTVLFNRLGGLQVRLPTHITPIPPSSSSASQASEREKALCEDGWTYIRPLPHHAIINLGDALVKFSKGKLRSNIHRVVGPPGKEQGALERWSLVYFCRPGDGVLLRSLVEGGDGVEDGEEGEEEEGVSAKEWILRRALGRRKVGGWEGSGGTEEVSMRGVK